MGDKEMFIRPANFFLLRTPFFPFSDVAEFFSQVEKGDISAICRKICENKSFQEAVYIASAEFFREIQDYLSGPPGDIKRARKIEFSIYKFFSRMCTRCTPYGLFASITTGSVSDHTDLTVHSNGKVTRKLRLDMVYLNELADQMLRYDRIRSVVKFIPNSSVYKVGNNYRFIDHSYEGFLRNYKLSGVPSNPVLKKLLDNIQKGATIAEMTDLLSDFAYSEAEISEYLNELISGQILVCELECNVTGGDYLLRLIKFLENHHLHDSQYYIVLSEVYQRIEDINSHHTIGDYNKVIELLEPLGINIDPSRIFHLDTIKPAVNASIDKKIAVSIQEAIFILSSFARPDSGRKNTLDQFITAFEEKYEAAAIPLAEALDAEIGIGYVENPATKDLLSEAPQAKWSKSAKAKLNILQECWKTGTSVYYLKGNEIPDRYKSETKLSSSCAAFFSIYNGEGEPLIHITNISGSTGINLLGRFCNSDANLKRHVESFLNKIEEGCPENRRVAFAQIAHLPQSRLGNVLQRPHLNEFEIPYLAHSTLPLDNQIKLQDLYLKIIDKKIYLFSKKLNKVVTPRVASAYNYNNSAELPIHKFLCELQYQDVSSLFWDWEFFNEEKHLPRIQYKNIILSPALWNIKKEMLAQHKPSNIEDIVHRFMKVLRPQLNIPVFINLLDSDNSLVLNLSLYQHCEYLVKECLKKGLIRISERLGAQFAPIVKDEHGQKFENEIILPLYTRHKNLAPPEWARITDVDERKRTFVPGSEWLYIKIYATYSVTESILEKLYFSCFAFLIRKKLVKKWFFIRYVDPKPHLRVRFLLENPGDSVMVLKLLHDKLAYYIKNRYIEKIQVDTYKREMERYNFHLIEESETLFYLNSSLIVKLIKSIGLDFSESVRQYCAIYFIDMFMKFVLPDEIERADFYKTMYTKMEFQLMLPDHKKLVLRDRLNRIYRTDSKVINGVLQLHQYSFSQQQALSDKIIEIMQGNFRLIKPIYRDIMQRTKKPNYVEMFSSHLHLFINRLMKRNPQEEEARIYFMLDKAYFSSLARRRAGKKPE
jgi:lantibiotic biosynthesis protein